MGEFDFFFDIAIENNIEKEKSTKLKTVDLTGKNFVFTGKLKGLTRAEASALVFARGGTVQSSVRNNTDYLVFADDAKNTNKSNDARQKGISVLTEEEFSDMI